MSDTPLSIIRLKSENIKRLHAVEITPDGNLITIGGANGAGKSSVLDSIAYALGGADLVPAEPIRNGESKAEVTVDLGEYIVTRKFTRELNVVEGSVGVWGPTRSTLTITNKDGARYPAPQKLLDGIVGELTFDPLEFATMKPAQQNEVLRQLVGLDFTDLNAERKKFFDERAMLKKSLAAVEVKLQGMPVHADVPEKTVPADEVITELQRADELRKVADEADHAVLHHRGVIVEHDRVLTGVRKSVADLEKQLADAKELETSLTGQYHLKIEELVGLENAASAARAAVPSTEELKKKLLAIDVTNKKVAENAARAEVADRLAVLTSEVNNATASIDGIDLLKKQMLEKASFPVPGLSLSDDGILFGGNPFEQASSAEQLRVSVAIGLARNPRLKVLLIRNGNLLDSKSLAAVATQAKEAGAQIWMEWVSETAEGVSVMIEDGSVAV